MNGVIMASRRRMRLACVALVLFFAGRQTQAAELKIADFEGEGYESWMAQGDAFGTGPANGTLPNQMPVSGFEGKRLANSYSGGDLATGSLTSHDFKIAGPFLSFLIGGGNHPDRVGMELLIDGKQVRAATGRDSEQLEWDSWDVQEFQGKTARLRIFDRETQGWGHILIDQIVFTDESRHRPIVGRLEFYRKSPDYYRERYRPQLHFSPEINWMNDPNGLVYYAGEYHLFYQYNPLGHEWGHMSWGHAVSKDLLHWEHLPIALHEEYGVMAFSGSAVFDGKNTSGLGQPDHPPLIAIYTGHGHKRQTQDIAFSLDRGRTWTKYAGNPVLDEGKEEFRDPKVFWHKPTNRWVMVVSLAPEKRLRLYASADLKSWKLLSEFGPAGVPNKPNWECPDLFELPVVNEPGETRWVLEADMGGGAIAGGSGGEYFIGKFDGRQFVAESLESQWVDFGRDFYAPVTWSNIPKEDGRCLWIGWMNNWETPLNPTYPWRSAMSIPRELTLQRVDGRLRLCQQPVRELESLRHAVLSEENLALKNETHSLQIRGGQSEFVVDFVAGTATSFGLRIMKGEQQHTEIGYEVATNRLYVDRTRSGEVGFHPRFAGRYFAPLSPDQNGHVRMRILVDACSVEVFGGQGEAVITSLIFPDPAQDGVELFSHDGDCKVARLSAFTLDSVWQRPRADSPARSR